MKMPKAPCLGCTDRYVGCHSLCDKYIKFNHECELVREERKRTAEQNQVQRDIEHRRIKMASEGRWFRRKEKNK